MGNIKLPIIGAISPILLIGLGLAAIFVVQKLQDPKGVGVIPPAIPPTSRLSGIGDEAPFHYVPQQAYMDPVNQTPKFLINPEHRRLSFRTRMF